jgi:hypothetical protein
MKVEILHKFTGFPDGVLEPEKTYPLGAVLDVGEEFGQMIVEKGLAKPIPAPGSSQPEDKHEAQHNRS